MITLTEDVIKKGKMTAASRGLAFSQLITKLINENFTIKEITEAATACDVKKDLVA